MRWATHTRVAAMHGRATASSALHDSGMHALCVQGASELPPAAQQPDAATAPAQQHRTRAGGASGKRARAQQQQQRQNGQQQSQHEEGGALQNGGSGPHAVGDTDPAQQQDGQLDAFRKQPQLATALTALLQQLHDPTTLLQPSTDVSATCRETAAVRPLFGGVMSLMGGGRAQPWHCMRPASWMCPAMALHEAGLCRMASAASGRWCRCCRQPAGTVVTFLCSRVS